MKLMETKNVLKNNKEKILYCYNNDNTPFEQVVAWFNLYLGYNIEQAVMMAYFINNHKRAAIYKGTDKQLESLLKIFNKKGLKTIVE